MTKPGFYQSWNGPKYQPPLLKPIMLLHRSSMAAAVMSGLCFILVLQARTVQGVYIFIKSSEASISGTIYVTRLIGQPVFCIVVGGGVVGLELKGERFKLLDHLGQSDKRL